MESPAIERKLTTILHADVAGYSRLMGADEVGTLRTLTAYRHITDPLIQQHHGRVVGSAGDSILAEFTSVVEAVQCAVEIQQTLGVKNNEFPPDRRMEFRIGINLGDVIVEGEQIYGDGVNIAARLESIAEPGGIYIAGTVYDQIKNKLPLHYDDLGEQRVKNIAEPVRVYRVVLDESERHKPSSPDAAQRNLGHAPPPGLRSTSSRLRLATRQIAIGLSLLVAIIGVGRYFFFPILTPEPLPQFPLLPDKPSLAVLPFINMSGDPEQEYFSDGITEDLTSDLSKISSLFVIARNSAFTYKGKAVKVQEVSRELGVRYVLEGSVRKAGDQVRITAQLIDATTGEHLWSERYDHPLTDIFALQDEIRQKIVLALKVKLTPEEQERFRRVPTDNLEAYDSFLRGSEHFNRYTKESHIQARQLWERAVELDPKYAAAYAGLSAIYSWEWIVQWSQDPRSLEQAFELAQKAVILNDSLPLAHLMLGIAYLDKKQHEQAIAEAERAIALDPNWASCYSELAYILTMAGRPADAVEVAEKAMRLDPKNAIFHSHRLGRAYRMLRRYDEALAILKRFVSLYPNMPGPRAELAFLYSELGRSEEARVEAAEILRISPNWSLEAWRQRIPYKNPADLERFLDGLRKAGLK